LCDDFLGASQYQVEALFRVQDLVLAGRVDM